MAVLLWSKMNSSDICHQVANCPGLFVDAFRGQFLREHTKNTDATFILSHYHGDHYTQLPRDFKYRGPAKIHCTPITARLLIDVHLVSKDLVVEHDYAATFRHRIVREIEEGGSVVVVDDDDDKHKHKHNYANITFYDANHCPGACIILIALPDGKTVHLHTGDMRYHPRFQEYPLLAQATQQRKLDLVYLDTTYCHPKHDFLTQDDAVDSIASQTQALLSESNTLVLLSCYSIGKEKVLYHASKRSGQSIYVSEKKWKMLNCIQEDEKDCESEHQQHKTILERCTRDPSASDLHVIPMGLAGEMWPYFQPNFQKLAKYVQDLENTETANDDSSRTPRKKYDKVVAFIPTGWADASNWNKKNAISTKTLHGLHAEVRLISYSEHSTFPELVSFIKYLKPRKVIPTVYSDASHKRQIEGRFRNMLDSNRAKQAFFRSMTTKSCSSAKPFEKDCSDAKENILAKSFDSNHTMVKKDPFKDPTRENDDDEIEVVCVVPSKKSPASTGINIESGKVDVIVSMGFDRKRAEVVLQECHGDMERAIHKILSEPTTSSSSSTSPTNGNRDVKVKDNRKTQPANNAPPTGGDHHHDVKKRKISDFFAQRKK